MTSDAFTVKEGYCAKCHKDPSSLIKKLSSKLPNFNIPLLFDAPGHGTNSGTGFSSEKRIQWRYQAVKELL